MDVASLESRAKELRDAGTARKAKRELDRVTKWEVPKEVFGQLADDLVSHTPSLQTLPA